MAERRVFIDFETNIAGEIFLVGLHWDARFEQIILNEGLIGAGPDAVPSLILLR